MPHTPNPHTTGNLASKEGSSLGYGTQAANCPDGALSKPHAAVSAGPNQYCYDANGSQAPSGVGITRLVSGVTHTLTYDGENRLIKVMNGSTTIASFVYDGDGQRVKSTLNGVTTTFVGNYYEKTGTSITKYYYMGTARVPPRSAALRGHSGVRNSTVKYLFGDQLGSTSVTTSSSGAIGSQERYKPFGEMYYTSGTLPTRYTFTGQYSYANTNEIGLLYYGARFYDPVLGRFASADTIIPGAGNPQSWDRFAYSINNPVNYTDPSGHCFVPATGQEFPYGGPGPCPAQMTVSGWDPSYGEKQDTNECATTSLAAGMSVVLGQKISKNDVTSKFRAMGRKWFKIGVPPKVQANGVNALNMGVKATFSQGTTRQDLIDGVLADKVIVPTVSWSKLKYYGHTVVVIGYRFNDDELIFFDPGTGEKVTESKWNEKWDDFEQSWLQQPRWFIPPGSMVTLELSQSSAPQNSQGTGCSGSCNSSVAQ